MIYLHGMLHGAGRGMGQLSPSPEWRSPGCHAIQGEVVQQLFHTIAEEILKTAPRNIGMKKGKNKGKMEWSAK